MPGYSAGTYLVTSVTYERRSLFQVEAHAELFIETLQHYRREGHFKLHAFVVMPDHVHFLITPQEITLGEGGGVGEGWIFISIEASVEDAGLAEGIYGPSLP